MSDGIGREFAYIFSHATNRYFIPNWGMMYTDIAEHAKYLQNIPNCSKVHLNALKGERLHGS